MNYTLPITKAMVKKAKKQEDGLIITIDGVPSAVLMSMEEYRAYESWKETEEILADKKLMASIRQGEKELAEGKGIPLEEIEEELGLK